MIAELGLDMPVDALAKELEVLLKPTAATIDHVSGNGSCTESTPVEETSVSIQPDLQQKVVVTDKEDTLLMIEDGRLEEVVISQTAEGASQLAESSEAKKKEVDLTADSKTEHEQTNSKTTAYEENESNSKAALTEKLDIDTASLASSSHDEYENSSKRQSGDFSSPKPNSDASSNLSLKNEQLTINVENKGSSQTPQTSSSDDSNSFESNKNEADGSTSIKICWTIIIYYNFFELLLLLLLL